MFNDVDETLRAILIADVPINRTEIDIAFDRPTRASLYSLTLLISLSDNFAPIFSSVAATLLLTFIKIVVYFFFNSPHRLTSLE